MIDFQELDKQLKGKGIDLDRVTDRLGRPIEPKIKPLLIVLNSKGYRTTASCEGHSLSDWKERMAHRVSLGKARLVNEGKRGLVYEIRSEEGRRTTQSFYAHPWVDLDLIEQQVKRLGRIVHSHNESERVHWYLEEYSDFHRLEAEPSHDLEVLQADIPRLEEYIYLLG